MSLKIPNTKIPISCTLQDCMSKNLCFNYFSKMHLGKKNNSYLWNSAWSRTLVKISAQSFSSGYFSVAFSNNNIGDSKQSTTD